MSVAEKQIETTKALFAGYDEYTADAVLAPRAPECVHHIYPRSLNRASTTNDEYRKFFEPMQPVMKKFKVTIHKIVNDPENHQCAVYASGVGDTIIAPYKNEYAFFLEFNEAGDKITKIEEFVDSAFAKEYLGKVKEWQKANGHA